MLDSPTNIFIYYILTSNNTFSSIDYIKLLVIMKNLSYPQDVVAQVGIIFSQSTTTFIGNTLIKRTQYYTW